MFYVKRSSKQNAAGFAYVGPLSEARAQKEAAAWVAAGESVDVIESTPAVKAAVRLWDKVTHRDDAKDVVTFRGEQMTFAYYKLYHEAA